MEDTQPTAPAAKPQPGKMSKEQRSKVMKEAATRRWEKQRKEAAKAARAAAKAAPVRKKAPAPKEFSSALKTAEKRLAKAILERAEAAAKYAVLSAEIPSLQRIIMALRNPLGSLPEYAAMPGAPSYSMPMAPTLEQIVGDAPLGYQNPPRMGPPQVQMPAQPQGFQPIDIPQQLHPANSMGRAGGGAIGGVELAEEDEDQFLKDPVPAGSRASDWH